MTLYTKPRAELFAQDAPSSEIEPFTAWLRGLGIAFDETNGYPEMESFNGLLQALNSYIKYLEQNGFAEWSSDLEYPVGAGVRVGAVWYRAKTQNIGKNPATSQNDWSVFLNASDLTYADPLQVVSGQISIKDATTTQKGVVRAATSTEVTNRSNVTAFINPSNVGQTFGHSLSAEGWCRLPNGLIMQWGKSREFALSSFPIPFPVACLNLTATPLLTGNDSSGAVAGVEIVSKSQFKVFCGAPTNTDLYWFAIGY